MLNNYHGALIDNVFPISLVSALCVLIAVCCFGTRWPIEFSHEFHGTDARLTYAYYMTVACCPLTAGTGILILIHTILLRDYLLDLKSQYLTAEQLLGKDNDDDVLYV